jgi:aminoglycoside 6'-N-acetyltransferase I
VIRQSKGTVTNIIEKDGASVMETKIRMRELTTKDIKEAVELYIAVFSAEPWNDQLTVSQITDYVSSMMAMNTYIGYCIVDSLTNELVGYALGFIKPWYQGKEYVIDTLLIAGKYQGKGFGSAFLEMIKEELLKKDLSTILLDTEEQMPAADFYKKNGFKPLPDNVTYYLSF